ncbi:citrate lyase, beta subunit protein [Phenylobacterium zucineum HLK1]|uniref:Citrate lyase, beta subunit protein n=1 Tax=Phenylobacterium zucineum (strain HLK1) TaxID=450851 RepID=B4RG00_PHEZH|nr:citrate lyase, beta subunit protein [Phenylobacterium zucineum HLK1]
MVLPKASPQAVRDLEVALTQQERTWRRQEEPVRVLPIATETAAAVFTLGAYSTCRGRLDGLTWGAEDLSAAIGAETPRDSEKQLTPVYEVVRTMALLGAAAADIPAIETVYPDFSDLAGLAAYAERGRRDGFVGMMAIHPAQVPVINSAFAPSQDEIAGAQRIIEAFAKAEAGVVALDGRMLDAPHLVQARRILSRAGRA